MILGTLSAFLRDIGAVEAFAAIDGLVWERYEPKRKQDPLAAADRDKLLDYLLKKRPFAEYVSLRLRFRGLTPSEVRGLHVGDFDRMTATAKITRSEHLHDEGATKALARERVVPLGEVADDVATLCGLRDPDESFVVVAEDTLRDNFTKMEGRWPSTLSSC